ncbi:TPA: glycosyltransferase family 2 protein [Candidatus Berkelbacteria bacterium]|uniref:Family 2 glycosyl transferase n=1 Tax=Berkelbacteria bacterium GW2011_GWE1_39_12 TaxID=1618337 RepID=A0A0G4B5A7_9BACT|nr:MAG: family 2 glycosyl transferase [Berkelbacteria bacterium GW2011_GWE1_39_12]HBO60770.1 glycosyltransferase family 2 protein [Candidatus Berkelbacteria bacterium]
MKLAILIPAFNEEPTITKVIKAIPKKIVGISEKEIFIIDDGSEDRTGIIARNAGAMVLTHLVNQGVGAATITGLEAAKLYDADIAITIDADGQHDPKEIEKIVNLIVKKKYDVVIGSRLLQRKEMPKFKAFGNFLMNWVTYAIYGLWVKDSQSGFKGFSKKAVRELNLTCRGYEICSEIIGEINRNNLKFVEMPIKTIYTEYSKKRGQYPLNAVNIVLKLIIKLILK